MEKQFSSAKQFSKEAMAAERKQTVKSIRAKRSEHFGTKTELMSKLAELVENAENKKLSAQEARLAIEQTEQKLNAKSENFFRRLWESREIKLLQSELGHYKLTEQTLGEELASLEDAMRKLHESLQDRSALQAAKQELDAFYNRMETAWSDYEEDRREGNIKYILQERETFVVHAFQSPAHAPADNGLLRKEIGWKDKLDLLALEPTISASGVNKHRQKTFAPLGVLLIDGQVEHAHIRDSGSRAFGHRERYVSQSGHPERIKAQLDSALDPAEKQIGHTEFVVSNPQIGGLFVRLEDDGTLSDLSFGSDTTIEEVSKVAKEKDLPLFALKNGEFFTLSQQEAAALGTPVHREEKEKIGPLVRTYTWKEKVRFQTSPEKLLAPKQALQMESAFSDSDKQAILEKFMTESPFNLNRFPEALQVAARAEGRYVYYLFNSPTRPPLQASENPTEIPEYAVGASSEKIKIIKTIDSPTSWNHYVELADGSRGVWAENRHKISVETRFRSNELKDHLYRQESIKRGIQFGSIFVPMKKLNLSMEDLLSSSQHLLKQINGYLTEAKQTNDSNSIPQYERWIKNLGTALYGLAEEAKACGDAPVENAAEALAEKYYSKQEYLDMVKRRVSETGTFKLTKEELLGEKG